MFLSIRLSRIWAPRATSSLSKPISSAATFICQLHERATIPLLFPAFIHNFILFLSPPFLPLPLLSTIKKKRRSLKPLEAFCSEKSLTLNFIASNVWMSSWKFPLLRESQHYFGQKCGNIVLNCRCFATFPCSIYSIKMRTRSLCYMFSEECRPAVVLHWFDPVRLIFTHRQMPTSYHQTSIKIFISVKKLRSGESQKLWNKTNRGHLAGFYTKSLQLLSVEYFTCSAIYLF